MRRTTIFSLTVAAVLSFVALPLVAEQPEELPAVDPEPIIVRRLVPVNESLPELAARLYDKVDYELKLRKLTAAIKSTKLELEARRERLAFYEEYFENTPALLITRQNARQGVLETELRLKQLRHKKLLALRHRADRVRLRKLVVAKGNVRLELDE